MIRNAEQAESIGSRDLLHTGIETAAAQLAIRQPMQQRNMGKVTDLPELMLCAADEKEPAVPEVQPFRPMTKEPPSPLQSRVLRYATGFGGAGSINPYTNRDRSPFEDAVALEREAAKCAANKLRNQELNTVGQLAKGTASKFDAVALPSNRFKVLEQSLKEAYEKHGGDHSMFQHFGRTLATEMSKSGITVRTSREGISFRSEEQELAVEFQLKSKVEPTSRKVHDVTVTAKAYDWVTKADVDLGANGIERFVGKMVFDKGAERKDRDPKGILCDGRELSEQLLVQEQDRLMSEKFKGLRLPGIDGANREMGDARMNSNLSASFAHAYKQGGMKAVEKLAADVNHGHLSMEDWLGATISSPLMGMIARVPSVIPIVDKKTPGELCIYRGFEVSEEEARLASVMSAEQLNKVGIVKYQQGSGYFKLHGAGAVIVPLDKKQQ